MIDVVGASHQERPNAVWREGWPVGTPERCQQVLLDDPYGRMLVDAEGRVVHLNPAAAALLGRSTDELVGHHFSKLLAPASLALARELFAEVLHLPAGEHIPIDLDAQRPDGTLVPLEVGGHRYFDDAEHPGLHLRLRPAGRQHWVEAFLTELVSGSPLAACLDPLARAIDVVVPRAHAAILYEHERGRFDRAVAPSAHPALCAVTEARPHELTEAGRLPWVEAMVTGEAHHVAVSVLPPQLAQRARTAGCESFSAFPVTVPPDSHPSVVVVISREEAGPPLIGEAQAVTKLLALVSLAFERSRIQRRLVRAATHDSLTALLNREELVARLRRTLTEGDTDHASLAVLYLDLDRFKPVNDEHGHLFGDDLLALVGQRLRSALRATDDIARVGGDEFVVVCRGVEDEAQVRRVADGLLTAASEPFVLGGVEVQVGASIGLALCPDHGTTPVELIDAADQGLYLAKRSGRGRARLAPARSTAAAAAARARAPAGTRSA